MLLLRVFENKVLGIMFGPDRDEVMARSGILHNGELYNLYYLPGAISMIKSMKISCTGHFARMTEKRNVYRLLVGRSEGKKRLGRPRYVGG
jgi:hypothetical protein